MSGFLGLMDGLIEVVIDVVASDVDAEEDFEAKNEVNILTLSTMGVRWY